MKLIHPVPNFIKLLATKHNLDPKQIMLGFIDNDCKELYVWEFEVEKAVAKKFKVLEIINLEEK